MTATQATGMAIGALTVGSLLLKAGRVAQGFGWMRYAVQVLWALGGLQAIIIASMLVRALILSMGMRI